MEQNFSKQNFFLKDEKNSTFQHERNSSFLWETIQNREYEKELAKKNLDSEWKYVNFAKKSRKIFMPLRKTEVKTSKNRILMSRNICLSV